MDEISRSSSETAADSDPARAWATEHYGFEDDGAAPMPGQPSRSGLRVSKAGAAALLGTVLALGGGAAAVAAEADGGPGGNDGLGGLFQVDGEGFGNGPRGGGR